MEDLYCILQIEPLNSSIALELGRRLRARGRTEDALRVLRSVVKFDFSFDTLCALGFVEYDGEKFEDAFTHLQQALLVAPETSPHFFELFKTLGNIAARRGDIDSAEDNYYKAHRLQPESDSLAVNLGTLLVQRAKWDEAAAQYRGALGLNPANDKAWIGLALCHRTKGDWELAWGNLEAALEYNPINEVALALALEWGSQEGREFRVLEFLRAFLVQGGWNEKFSVAFAWLSWRRGDREVARLELERVLAVNPGSAQALNLIHEMRLSE